MEIITKRVTVKLDKEEREHLIATIDLLDHMGREIPCGDNSDCPFKTKCDQESDSKCLLGTIKEYLKYINNNCD